jgi:hypothetical protein
MRELTGECPASAMKWISRINEVDQPDIGKVIEEHERK